MVSLSPADWHERFRQQAGWTRGLREYLFPRAGLAAAGLVLEVGCGTGALLPEILAKTRAEVHGIDLDLERLRLAQRNAPEIYLAGADAHCLPYPDRAFDLTLCHFLLLWVIDPLQVVGEMRRVTRVGGSVLALAEPDYGGRVDYPLELALLGKVQAEALRQQGAETDMGRRIAGLFHATGLQDVESGVLGAQWGHRTLAEDWEREWNMLSADLAGVLPEADLLRLRQIDQQAWQTGERILYVPTFYAWGKVGE